MNALEELQQLNDLVSQDLRLALRNCAALDKLAAEARQTAFAARQEACRTCPHPSQFIVSYYDGPALEGRVCRLCGLHEGRECTGYKVLTSVSYSEDEGHTVDFHKAMSYRTMTVEGLGKP